MKILLTCCVLLACVSVDAAMITSDQAEMKVMLDEDMSAEQLQMIKEIHKEQLDAAKAMLTLDAKTQLQQAQAATDSDLARQVVFWAGACWVVCMLILFYFLYRERLASSANFQNAPPPVLPYQPHAALPEYQASIPVVRETALVKKV